MMEGFADIEAPLRVGWLVLVAWSALAILLILGLALLAATILRRRGKAALESSQTKINPLEEALARLNHLRTECDHLEADPFVVQVSDVVRNYLEAALMVPAREQTSEEFLHTLQIKGDLPPILHDHMPGFLAQCDRVKFARQLLAEGQKQDLLQTAGTVVTETDQVLHRDSIEPREAEV